MKHKVWLLITLFMLLAMPMASAEIQTHYNGNSDYPMVDLHQGYVTYIDKTSLYVRLYAPPNYWVSVVTFVADDYGNGTAFNYKSHEFDYVYNDPDMFINRNGPRERWYPLFEHGRPNYELMKIGEAAFYLEYGIRFYGRQKWLSKNTGTYEECLPDEFYDILDNKK